MLASRQYVEDVGPDVERVVQPDGLLEQVAERQQRHDPVLHRWDDAMEALDRRNDVVVGQRHALRRAGRPAREDELERLVCVGLAPRGLPGLPVGREGRVVVGRLGYTYLPGPPWILYESSLTRLDASGSPDAGFGAGGTAVISGEYVAGLAARTDGSLIGLHAPIDEGYKSVLLCHLGNIAWRTGRALACDPKTGRITGDAEAERMWRREYRKGWEPKV